MNCHETRRHWNLYHDSEGDAALHFQVNEHLAGCPACAEWFHDQSRLEDLLVAKLRSVEATPALWASMRMAGGITRPAHTGRLLLLCSLVSVAALLLISLGPWRLWEGAGSRGLARLSADWHERLVEGAAQAEFASTSDLEVEHYLRRRVEFPVRCPPRKDAGFLVEGAGVCRLWQDDAAYLVGRVAETPVSVFILSDESLQRFPHDREVLEREAIHRCREGNAEMVMGRIDRNVVLVVGRTDSARLRRVLEAYGTYPDDQSG